MDNNYHKSFASTQRLPKLGPVPPWKAKAAICRRCQKTLWIPITLTQGDVRCQFCGELHKVGIPATYIRIACDCGKILTALKKYAGQYGRCPGCNKSWQVPGTPTSPATMRPVEQEIPAQYERIVCPCGKILTAPKNVRGASGRCPHCGRTFIVGMQEAGAAEGKLNPPMAVPKKFPKTDVPLPSLPQILDVVASPFVGPIHFKCPCGQLHMVEGERANSTIICFRCGKEVAVPATKPDNNPDTTTLTPAALASSQPEKAFAVEQDQWYLQTAYPTENLHELLQIPWQADIGEIKKACRTIQSQVKRDDPIFQKAQQAKDILTKPETRLWYEIVSNNLVVLWQGLATRKWLKLHDKAVNTHLRAIETEKHRLFYKADALWVKAVSCWQRLVKNKPFWEAVAKRGEALFAAKFNAELVETFEQQVLDKIVVDVACQFRERYLAENNLIRADFHLKVLVPVLEHIWDNNPGDAHNKKLLCSYLMNETQKLAEQLKVDKAIRSLIMLHNLNPQEKECQDFISQLFAILSPSLFLHQRESVATQLGIRGNS